MVLGQERTIRRLLIVLQYTIVAYTNGGGVKDGSVSGYILKEISQKFLMA